MVVYYSAKEFIETSTELCDKILKIKQIIFALEDKALEAIGDEDVTEYMLDDGQTKIKTVFRGTKAILNAINGYEQLLQRYVNRLHGRQVRLVDSKSLRRHDGRF